MKPKLWPWYKVFGQPGDKRGQPPQNWGSQPGDAWPIGVRYFCPLQSGRWCPVGTSVLHFGLPSASSMGQGPCAMYCEDTDACGLARAIPVSTLGS